MTLKKFGFADALIEERESKIVSPPRRKPGSIGQRLDVGGWIPAFAGKVPRE
jgi:hypothetical protein